MTRTAKYSWASLLTTGMIFLFFVMRMLDGGQVVEPSPTALLGIYVKLIVMFIIAETVIAIGLAVTGAKHNIEKDERDLAIEARANQYGSYFVIAAVNVIIIYLLAGSAFDSRAVQLVDMTSTSSAFFVLFSVLIFGHLIGLGSALISYAR